MKTAFIETADDIQWLKDVHLNGVSLPEKWADFKYAILQGNEDAPYAVNLFLSAEPHLGDDYFRVKFQDIAPLSYCESCEYDGATNKPRGGLIA